MERFVARTVRLYEQKPAKVFASAPAWVVRAAVAQVGRREDRKRRGRSSSRKCGNKRNPSSKPASYIRTSRATPLHQDLSLLRIMNFRSDFNSRSPVRFVGKIQYGTTWWGMPPLSTPAIFELTHYRLRLLRAWRSRSPCSDRR